MTWQNLTLLVKQWEGHLACRGLATIIHRLLAWSVCGKIGWVKTAKQKFEVIAIFASSIQFLAHDSIYAIARYMPSPVRPSVHLSVPLSVPLSVTRVDQSKTVTVRITQPSPQSSPMTLVS